MEEVILELSNKLARIHHLLKQGLALGLERGSMKWSVPWWVILRPRFSFTSPVHVTAKNRHRIHAVAVDGQAGFWRTRRARRNDGSRRQLFRHPGLEAVRPEVAGIRDDAAVVFPDADLAGRATDTPATSGGVSLSIHLVGDDVRRA